MIDQHGWQAGGFALDTAGASYRGQKLPIFDVALSPGSTRTDLVFDCLLYTKVKRKSDNLKKKKYIYTHIHYKSEGLTFANME